MPAKNLMTGALSELADLYRYAQRSIFNMTSGTGHEWGTMGHPGMNQDQIDALLTTSGYPDRIEHPELEDISQLARYPGSSGTPGPSGFRTVKPFDGDPFPVARRDPTQPFFTLHSHPESTPAPSMGDLRWMRDLGWNGRQVMSTLAVPDDMNLQDFNRKGAAAVAVGPHLLPNIDIPSYVDKFEKQVHPYGDLSAMLVDHDNLPINTDHYLSSLAERLGDPSNNGMPGYSDRILPTDLIGPYSSMFPLMKLRDRKAISLNMDLAHAQPGYLDPRDEALNQEDLVNELYRALNRRKYLDYQEGGLV